MAELTPDATKAMNMRANGERPWSFHDSFDVCRNDRLLLLQHSDALAARLAEADALLREARQRTQNLLHRQHGDQIIMNPDDYLRATLSWLDAAIGKEKV